MTMTKKRTALMGAVAIAVVVGISACTDTTGQDQEEAFTAQIQRNYNKGQPPHDYSASQARENLIAAQDAMATGADTWTVQTVPGVGVIFECPSVGFPIPFGTNVTNPQGHVANSAGGYELPLMEPYGLYPPADVAATYANCVLPSGEVAVFYSEPDITAFTFDVEFDAENGIYTIPHGSEASIDVTEVKDVKIADAAISEPSTDETNKE